MFSIFQSTILFNLFDCMQGKNGSREVDSHSLWNANKMYPAWILSRLLLLLFCLCGECAFPLPSGRCQIIWVLTALPLEKGCLAFHIWIRLPQFKTHFFCKSLDTQHCSSHRESLNIEKHFTINTCTPRTLTCIYVQSG